MTRIGMPVPFGFTITTEACLAYLEADRSFPDGLWDQIGEAVAKIEAAAGKRFGDLAEPLLLSCRSGAKFSMPGMMDTVLNLGLNEAVVENFAQVVSDGHFVHDSFRRLVPM